MFDLLFTADSTNTIDLLSAADSKYMIDLLSYADGIYKFELLSSAVSRLGPKKTKHGPQLSIYLVTTYHSTHKGNLLLCITKI